jgi:hypothetical protein
LGNNDDVDRWIAGDSDNLYLTGTKLFISEKLQVKDG